jgi:ABC-type cobalamin/Fe3+-siderophores transport system ATPase subunit
VSNRLPCFVIAIDVVTLLYDASRSWKGERVVSEVLRLDGVWTSFDRGHDRASILEDVSLSVAAGEIVAVVGDGGHGKTTLIRLASGTLLPDRGSVCVNGVEVGRLTDKQLARVLAGDVGLATSAGPNARITVREYIEIAAAAPKEGWRRKWRLRERRRMATAVLDELGISECASLRWEQLSDWQRVLVELAQAVIVRPRLLLVDDIADGFGLGQKKAVMDLLEGFAREGCGVFMAVSDHASALRAVRVWQLQRRGLRLMANHSDDDLSDDACADVIPLRRWSDAR